jgi:hypothetical protein
MPRTSDLTVFITSGDSRCDECREDLGRHACRKFSGRVGRTRAAQDLEQDAIRLAVIAHIRHAQTPYDDLLLQGWDRHEARAQVRDAVDAVLRDWEA